MGQKLEKHFQIHGIHPDHKFMYKGLDVYIAEGGPYSENGRLWYESAWAIGKDNKPILYQPLEFEFTHDLNLTQESRRQARINAAIKQAKRVIDDGIA
jgi:hypothetical protein